MTIHTHTMGGWCWAWPGTGMADVADVTHAPHTNLRETVLYFNRQLYLPIGLTPMYWLLIIGTLACVKYNDKCIKNRY